MQELEILFKVAQMYYEQKMTQNDIAEKLYISRSNVSRLIKQANEEGIVEVTVHYPFERMRRIEIELRKRFDLEEIRIIDTGDRTPFNNYTATTKLAASYINMQLNNNSTLALTCGNTICGMVHELRPKGYLPDMQVVPLMGSIESSNVILDGHYLVRQVSEIYGCRHYYIMTPFRVDDESTCQKLLNRPAVIETLSLAENATIMCTGIGSDVKSPYLTSEERKAFEECGAIGYISGYYFDKNGQIVNVSKFYNKMICASRKMFSIPTRCAVVADVDKAKATLGALRGKLINVLITNSAVANGILYYDDKSMAKI